MSTTGLRVLVTGGAGFIGSNLARHLLASGTAASVRVVDDLSSGLAKNLDGVPVDFHRLSILDKSGIAELARDQQAIVHLAAVPSVPRSIVDPMRSHDTNVTGTLHVLEAARTTGAHVVVASSSSVYGSNPALPKSEGLRCIPMSPYAASKLAAEAYALAYAHCYRVPVLAFRFFNVFGPSQAAGHAYAAVVPTFISAALRNLSLPIDGDGTQTRDFTYVGTVVETIAQALRERVTYHDPLNLAFGSRTSLLQLIGLIEEILGRPLPREHRAERAGDVRDSQADATLLRTLFPAIRSIPLKDALRETVQWFQSECGLG